jgi:hypothetical protein
MELLSSELLLSAVTGTGFLNRELCDSVWCVHVCEACGTMIVHYIEPSIRCRVLEYYISKKVQTSKGNKLGSK